jgi:beta-glucanase (GH16 family)
VVERVTELRSTVVFSGRAVPRARVHLQVRGTYRWVPVRSTRATARGRFRIAIAYPTRTRAYRVVSSGRRSTVRRVSPPPAPVAAPKPVAPAPAPAPVDDCGSRPRKASGGHWSCSFHDEFEGTSLDTSKWLVQETWYSGMTTGNKDCFVNNDKTVAVESGVLKLTANRKLAPFTCKSPLGDFTSTSTASTVATWGRFTQVYGRFAFRAKLPPHAGIPGPHSALWLYPQQHTYGPWPKSGEIDVAEWFAAQGSNVYPSVHYEGEDTRLSSGYNCPMPTAGSDYHTYAVEWTTTEMKFFYDDRLCYSHKWTPSNVDAPQPFDHPFYIVLSQAWGSLWNAPTDSTPTSSTLTVDWVRAWK